MTIVAVDVDYREDHAIAAAVAFAAWTDAAPLVEVAVRVAPIAPYQPGAFFVRELPCVAAAVAALRERLREPITVLVVDGYAWLAPDRPGLGVHVRDALGVPVVGVAKSAFAGAQAVEVLRGTSKRPLFVTAAGVDVDEAARHVREMHGADRVPTLLRRVDRLCRDAADPLDPPSQTPRPAPSTGAMATPTAPGTGTPVGPLSDATRGAIAALVATYPHKKTALLPSLKLAQKEKGWLSRDTLAEVADLIGLPHSHAVELATFYSMLFTEPAAPVRVEVCVQLPCALVGADDVVKKLATKLGVEMHQHSTGAVAHGHTADHKIELHSTVECYGACHRAPMCRVGDDYREHLVDDAALDKLVAELKERAARA